VKVLVCGGRQFDDAETLAARLSEIHRDQAITEIIEGGAVGADTLAREFGEHKGIPVRTFPADWDTHGRAAGPIRNRQMLDEGKPDLVVAFPGGRGTANMVKQARAAGVKVLEIAIDAP
jgi:YspA, cpYpsA-related SLOG family